MVMRDRETSSLWSCYNGVAIDGDLAGASFERVPTYLCQLWEWLEEHPESEVLAGAGDARHSDARHGHGSWFHFGCRGPHPHARQTMLGEGFDDRLPEHELVLGICHRHVTIAFPLSAIHRADCLIHATIGDEPAVVWARSHGSSWMAAFSRRFEDEVLELEKVGNRFRDGSGTLWTVDGRAVSGPRAGGVLTPLDFVAVKWSAWAGFQPNTEVYSVAGDTVPHVPVGELRPLFDGLAAAGYEVEIEREILGGSLPPAAVRGLVARIGGDRFAVYSFSTPRRAVDYAGSRRLLPKDRYLSFFPGEEPSDLPRHARASGIFVVESDPEVQFRDPDSLEPLPESEIAWSKLLDDPSFEAALRGLQATDDDEPCIGSLIQRLTAAELEVRRVKPMLRQWLRPDAVDGYSMEIDRDRFLVYLFAEDEAARRYSAQRHHTVDVGPFVLRSDPPGQYHVATEQTVERPVEQVAWSNLVSDRRLLAALGAS